MEISTITKPFTLRQEYMLEFEDVPSGEKAVFKRDLDLAETDVLPTTNSRNIKCNYVLAVRCEVPFATSIDATLVYTFTIKRFKDLTLQLMYDLSGHIINT